MIMKVDSSTEDFNNNNNNDNKPISRLQMPCKVRGGYSRRSSLPTKLPVTKSSSNNNSSEQIPQVLSAPLKSMEATEVPLKSTEPTINNTITEESNESIKVFVRVRKSILPCSNTCEIQPDSKSLILNSSSNTTRANANLPTSSFTFDHIFPPSSTQEDVFTKAGKGVVDNILNGYNGTIFAYGNTSSGKTYTMQGPPSSSSTSSPSSRGLIPRMLEYLFSKLENEKFSAKCSFLEIYNERIYDLLDNNSVKEIHEGKPRVRRRSSTTTGSSTGIVYVENLKTLDIHSVSDAIETLEAGSLNRRVGTTNMNRTSSRSHSVFTVTLESSSSASSACLNLIDLAGSERQSYTQTSGIRLKEAATINKSLSALGNVIMTLAKGGKKQQQSHRRHVSFRDSKLTFLLRDSLSGNAKVTMIATISPEDQWMSESVSTLKFAKRAKLIKTTVLKNTDSSEDDSVIAKLKQEIAELKASTSSSHLEAPENDNDLRKKIKRLEVSLYHSLKGNELANQERLEYMGQLNGLFGVIKKQQKVFSSLTQNWERILKLNFDEEVIQDFTNHLNDASNRVNDALREEKSARVVLSAEESNNSMMMLAAQVRTLLAENARLSKGHITSTSSSHLGRKSSTFCMLNGEHDEADWTLERTELFQSNKELCDKNEELESQLKELKGVVNDVSKIVGISGNTDDLLNAVQSIKEDLNERLLRESEKGGLRSEKGGEADNSNRISSLESSTSTEGFLEDDEDVETVVTIQRLTQELVTCQNRLSRVSQERDHMAQDVMMTATGREEENEDIIDINNEDKTIISNDTNCKEEDNTTVIPATNTEEDDVSVKTPIKKSSSSNHHLIRTRTTTTISSNNVLEKKMSFRSRTAVIQDEATLMVFGTGTTPKKSALVSKLWPSRRF